MPSTSDNAVTELQDVDKPFSDYKNVAQPAIKALVQGWQIECGRTDSRRKTRYVDVDIDGEKDTGSLDKDEIFTPVYLIDSNIRTQQSKKASYLTKSERVAILSCNEDASVSGAPIEKDFTLKARYNEWEVPMLKWIDGSEMHAWDTLEILFDEDKPGNFDIEHCEHDKLLYPEDTKHLQKADFLVRVVDVTPKDLSRLVKSSNFSAVQVNKILADNNSNNENATNGEPASH